MKATWLGQGGWLLTLAHSTLLLDPYLSDSVAKIEPQNTRRMPIDPQYLHCDPDFLLLTHAHADHLDPETLHPLLDTEKKITVCCPNPAWSQVRTFHKGHNYVLLEEGSAWREEDFTLFAVHAAHSDPGAVGFLLFCEGKSFYFSGDTLYNRKTICQVRELAPLGIDVAFVPINGVGNNMNVRDAKALLFAIDARCGVPMHFGLFDEIDPHLFDYPVAKYPAIYQTLEF